MKYLIVVYILLLAPLLEASSLYQVINVVDGDTLDLSEVGRVRLIGVDTPETVHPKKPVEYFGKEASSFLRSLILGKKVRINYENGNRKDRYGRTLGYVSLEDGTLVNAKIISDGYGFAYTKYPFSKMEEFRALEKQARTNKKGLWADRPAHQPRTTMAGCEKRSCSSLKSCEEAIYLLKVCGFSSLDGDKDGIPCESLCRKASSVKVISF